MRRIFGTGPKMLLCAMRNDYGSTADALRGFRVGGIKWRSEPLIRKQSSKIDTRDGLELWQTPYGEYWIPAGSEQLSNSLAEEEAGFYGRSPKPGDIVLDCGANVGTFSRKAAAAGAKVIAVEPVSENQECLRRNLADLIQAGKVVMYTKGLWSEKTNLTISKCPTDSGSDSFVMPHDGPTEILPVTTLDAMVAELRLPRVDFIKMDIEGAERHALRGAIETLRKYRPRLAICVYHLPDDRSAIPAVVREALPTYRMSSGLCQPNNNRAVPRVLFFN